ncbi:hypothetical protein QE152_g8317 [Popillia japonica]|uniref:Uncharacterized protein n=1 Tax=Popillia japonica TaxID=7064 RepID=A0AAW1M9Z4_POPJA
MMYNLGQTISLKNIPELVGSAYGRVFVPKNIFSGFATTRIFPYNPYVFGDHDFAGAEVINRPQEIEEAPSTSHQNEDVENSELLEPTTPTTLEADSCNSPSVESLKSTLIRTPQEVRLYPKAAPRKQKAGRKPGKTRIVTDTLKN